MVSIGALALFTDDPVFLNRFAAPECVFSLYPISLFFKINISTSTSFLEEIKPLIIVYPQEMVPGQLELYLLTRLSIYLKD